MHWTMISGGEVTWREWERMGGEAAGSEGGKRTPLLDLLLPNVYILFWKIYVGHFKSTVWVITRDAKVQEKAEIFFLI